MMDRIRSYLYDTQHIETISDEPPRVVHPYYPTSLALSSYDVNNRELFTNVTQFTALIVACLSLAWLSMRVRSPKLVLSDKLIVLWFVLSGTLHIFFEGYLILKHETLPSSQDLFAQMWKEYALSDSRYLVNDTFVLSIEAVTVIVWGPLCYLTAILVAKSSSLRFSFQAIVSVAHIYGDTLYFVTSFYDTFAKGIEHSRPEPVYFWFYFVGLNAIWIVIPSLLLYQSIVRTSDAFITLDKIDKLYKNKDKTS